jgi:hypothetical protein
MAKQTLELAVQEIADATLQAPSPDELGPAPHSDQTAATARGMACLTSRPEAHRER